MSDETEDRAFLSRWAKRKAEARSPEPSPEDREEPSTAEAAEPAEELSEEEIEAKLAEVEKLKQGDDFKPFIKATMPEVVRRAALRRLWRSNPIFSFLDGMNDYDLDYTNKATVVANLKTAYRVGKGYLTKEEAEAEEAGEGGRSTEEAGEEGPAAPESGTAEADAEGRSSEIDQALEEGGPSAIEEEPTAPDLELPSSAAEHQEPASALAIETVENKNKENHEVKQRRAAAKRWDRFRSS